MVSMSRSGRAAMALAISVTQPEVLAPNPCAISVTPVNNCRDSSGSAT
jgi:hypothetical protein